ncbi:MAG: RHS repeat-associated core domain-containing protein [Bacteroidia bacterium]
MELWKTEDDPDSETFAYTFTTLDKPTPQTGPATTHTRRLSLKYYELSNHLGNILATVSDKKSVILDDNDGVFYIASYAAEVLSVSDYYPFGAPMPGRSLNLGDYRFGFNGKESDGEISGDGNSYDFGARVYDSRIGRWLSRDPLEGKYPGMSPYAAFNDNPILYIDPDGNDGRISVTITNDGTVHIKLATTVHVIGEAATSNTVKLLQNKFNSIDRSLSFSGALTEGLNVVVDIDITFKQSSLPDSYLRKAKTNSFYIEQLQRDESHRKTIDYNEGDNFLETGESAWAVAKGKNGVLENSLATGFGYLMGFYSQVPPVSSDADESNVEINSAMQEIMHLLGFDERYQKGLGIPQPGFKGDVQSNDREKEYIHGQHFFDIYKFAKNNGLIDAAIQNNGKASMILHEDYKGNKPTFDDTNSGRRVLQNDVDKEGKAIKN